MTVEHPYGTVKSWMGPRYKLDALESYLLKHGRPVAFYSDKHTVFRVVRPNPKMNGKTQFGRALAELEIEILCANSSQAKGRVERAKRTLQDRLVKELRLAGLSSMEEGNAFLEGFVQRHNAKIAKAPTKPDNLHRALKIEPDRLNEVLCLRDQRYVPKDLTHGLISKYIDVYEYGCGRMALSCLIRLRTKNTGSRMLPSQRINASAQCLST
jgi:hypothetical protein